MSVLSDEERMSGKARREALYFSYDFLERAQSSGRPGARLLAFS